MNDQLLTILKLCLLVLLYLFFLRVIRAVWAELKGPRTLPPGTGRPSRAAVAPPAPKGRAAVLKMIEPVAQAGRNFALGGELTLGRAAGCSITLDDNYVSQIHARVFERDGEYYVEDLGSTNGTYLNRAKVSGPMVIRRGERLQVGSTVMELG